MTARLEHLLRDALMRVGAALVSRGGLLAYEAYDYAPEQIEANEHGVLVVCPVRAWAANACDTVGGWIFDLGWRGSVPEGDFAADYPPHLCPELHDDPPLGTYELSKPNPNS